MLIWATFSSYGKSDIAFVKGNQKAVNYVETLENYLFTTTDNFPGRTIIFQQDNATTHKANATTQFLNAKNIRTLAWPARSPDLNPIENLWADIAKKVYGGGNQYNCVNDLKRAILTAWTQIPLTTTPKLVASMKDRIYEVIL